MDGNIAAYEQFYPEETGVECPSCKGGHFVTKMEIESNCCWYCGGSIKNRKGNEDMESEYSEPKPQEYRLFMDGNVWCAVCGDFVDLQNSPAGFGDTPTEALQNLLQIFQGATP